MRHDSFEISYDIDFGIIDDEPEPKIGTTDTDAEDAGHAAVAQGAVSF